MFDEKSLLRAVMSAEKGGIMMMFTGSGVYLVAENWMAQTTMDAVREHYRGLLGHLAEVLGYIPENEAVKIRKAKGMYDVQPVLHEIAAADIAFYGAHDNAWPLQHTGLHWRGALLQDQAKRIYRCALQGPHLTGGAYLTDNKRFMTWDPAMGEAVYEIAYRPEFEGPDRERELWKHLESVWWAEWAEDTIDDWEQEEIDDE